MPKSTQMCPRKYIIKAQSAVMLKLLRCHGFRCIARLQFSGITQFQATVVAGLDQIEEHYRFYNKSMTEATNSGGRNAKCLGKTIFCLKQEIIGATQGNIVIYYGLICMLSSFIAMLLRIQSIYDLHKTSCKHLS